MKILIVKLSSFGDIIHALPVVKYIKEVVPESEIHWVVDEEFSSLFKRVDGVSRCIEIPLRKWKKHLSPFSVRDFFGKIRDLRSVEYDFVVDIQGNTKSGIVTFLARGKVKGGFATDGVREIPNLLFTNKKIPLSLEDKHISRKYLRIVSGVLECDQTDIELYPSISPDKSLKEKFREKINQETVKIAIHHGTTWETKGLSIGKWVSAIRSINRSVSSKDRVLTFYLTWGNEREREKAEKIAKGVREKCEDVFLNVVGDMDLDEFMAFLSLMDVVIGPDTGPIHLAAALGVKTVSFYRVTLAERNAPVGPNHRSIQADIDCKGCLKKKCEYMDKCERSIDTENFSRFVQELLSLA